jgi:hypothetical protein
MPCIIGIDRTGTAKPRRGKAMMYEVDLAGTGPERQVGYLARGHSFTKGTASEVFFDCLAALVEQPLMFSPGYHTCDLGWCGLSLGGEQPKFRYKGRVIRLGATDILVPGDEVVYVAPSLILHYIRWHRYLPPSCFVKAVLNCPDPRSQEYSGAIKRLAPEWALFFGFH